jgi:LysM repeat protein
MGIKKMKQIHFFIFLCFFTFAVSYGQQKEYVQYTVKKGETMRVIAKKLEMKTRDLLRLNPDIGRKPRPNTVIIIPNINFSENFTQKEAVENTPSKEEIQQNIREELETKFVVYEVKKGDAFYSLTRFYNVSQEALLLLNPELSEGLKVGQLIKIKPRQEGEAIDPSIYQDSIAEKASLKVGLLLPFKTNENDTIPSNELFTKSRLATIVTDVYLGAEIAIDSLKKQGVSIALNVFDTERNSTQIDSILLVNDLNKNDVIIGPLYSEEAEEVARQLEIPVIFPFYSKNQYKFSSDNLITTSPEIITFREELIGFLKDSISNQNIILVSDGEAASDLSSIHIKQSLQTHDSLTSVHIVKPKDGYIARERFTDVFQPDISNWVVIASDDNVIVADAINSANSLSDSLSMRVFSYNKGAAYDKIDNFKLAKLNYTYVSDEFADEASFSTQIFNSQYLKKNNALPSFYATKAFDITYDILMRLASGNNLKSTFQLGASYRVETKFDYANKPTGISENKGVFIVRYNKDLSLTRLK